MTILINPFEVPIREEESRLLAQWENVADYVRTRPGYIGTRLHRSLRPDAKFRFINIAEWESPAAFMATIETEEFQRRTSGIMERFPHYPDLYEIIRR